MGQLKKIKEIIRIENTIPNQLIKEIPSEIQDNLNKFQPHSFDLKNTIKNFHDDNRTIITSGAYVPIPFILMMLPIFTGGKITDTREYVERSLNMSGNKSGMMNVQGEALSSDLCFYVFAFLMQMAIHHNTTLLHISNNYLMEFLGWKNTSLNQEKINTILEKLYSIEYGGTYGGLFKNINKKKEERYNIFSGRLIDGYYQEKTGFIINLSETILSLFAFEKIWYGINLENYSKIPTGHCKSLFTYIGAKSRGASLIDIDIKEIFERMALNTIKTNKQKIKIVKESLDILKELSIIKDYSINGHFIEQKTIQIILTKNKKENKSFFDLEHLEENKSYSSINCHRHHNALNNLNTDIKNVHSKILRIFNFKDFVEDYTAKNIMNKIQKDNYGFLKNVYNDNKKVQIELKKNESHSKIRNWLNNDSSSAVVEDINKQIIFEKPRRSKEIKKNIEVLYSASNNIYGHLISDAKDFLNSQKENFNNQEKLVNGFLVRQTESTSALAEDIKDHLDNANIDSSVKTNIYKTLFNYIDNISVGLVHDLKESKIPHQIYSDGTLKIKTINDNNFQNIKFNCDLRNLINKLDADKHEFLNKELENGKISTYDYKNKSNSNKLYYKNLEQTDKELVEGHKIFWWQSKIDNNDSRTYRYGNYDNEIYNEYLNKYRINDLEHHKALISTIIDTEKQKDLNEKKYNANIVDTYIQSIVKEKKSEIEIYEKMPVINKDNQEIFISSDKKFVNYLENHNLSLIFKNMDGSIKAVLKEVNDKCKPIKYIAKINKCSDNYKKEYMNIHIKAKERENVEIDCYLDLPLLTLSESKRIKNLELVRDNYIDYIENEIEEKNSFVIENTYKFNFDELLDSDNIF